MHSVRTSNNPKERKLMKNLKLKRVLALMIAAVAAFCVWASPWTLPVKAAMVGAEKIGGRAGGHVVGKAAVRGGTALAAATAKHEAAKATAHAAVGKATGVAAGRIVKTVTPGKILAAGGATALVVGAHETADGVQAMGEGVAVAARENPDVAKDLLHEFFALPKHVVVTISICAMALLTWLCWPFLMLVRNWFRLMAARKARALAAAVPAEEVSKPVGQNLGAAGFARIGVIWAVAGFVLLTVFGVWRFSAVGNTRVDKPVHLDAPSKGQMGNAPQGDGDMAALAAKRAKVVAELRKNYEATVDRIHMNFLAELDSTARAEFGRVRSGIPRVVEPFGTMSRCTSLVKAIVLDKWKGGTRTEDSVKQDLETSYYSDLYAARDNVAGCLQRLAANLASARSLLAVQLEEELASVELPGDEAYKTLLQDCCERIEKSKQDLAFGQIEAGISVAIEAVCIRQTVSVLASLLGKTAARQAGTMATGAGAAAVDGPLPVGDIVGGVAVLGCTAWTAWDVYQATRVLPAKLADTLTKVTRDCESQCRDEVKKAGEKLIAQSS